MSNDIVSVPVASYRTTLVVDGEALYCSNKETAAYISDLYPPGSNGSKSSAENRAGGIITNKKEFLSSMFGTFAEEGFEFRAVSNTAVSTQIAPSSRTIATDDELEAIDMVRSWDIGKRMSGLLWRFSEQYMKRAGDAVTASSIATALSNDYLELAAILKAHGLTNLMPLDDQEKRSLSTIELGPLFAAFSKSKENFVIYAVPEFLYFALGYSDFKLLYLENYGYLLSFDIDFVLFDFNFGLIAKTPSFDSRLAQFNIKIDYWSQDFAAIMILLYKIIHVTSVGTTYTVDTKMVFPPSDYPILKLSQAILPKMFDRLLKLVPEKDRSVVAPNEWAAISRPTLAVVAVLRKMDSAQLRAIVEAVADVFAASTSALETVKLDFPMVDEMVLAVNQRFVDEKGKRSVSQFLFSEREFQVGAKKLQMTGIARVISILAGAVRKMGTLEGFYGDLRVPSVGQWKRWLKSGRAMRSKTPCVDVLKEYCVLPSFPAEIKGASTTSKVVRCLDVCLEFFPKALDCDVFHYVGITPKDNMFGYLWARWKKAKGGDHTVAAASFLGYDIRALGNTILEAADGFKMMQGDNFTTIPFEKLIANDYGNRSHFLLSDAFIVHAAEGDGYNKSNPFHKLPVPPNWPPLVGKVDFESATEEEEGLYSFFSWCAYRYQSGAVKFHLDPKISQGFWSIIGKRFMAANVMCMVWKCGRPHNLEFHFFFSRLIGGSGKPATEQKEDPKEEKSSGDGVKAMAAPEVEVNLDLYVVVRNQAIVYFTTVAAYEEVHRAVTFINPIVDMMSSQADLARSSKASNFAMMTSVVRGYRDVSFIPVPPVQDADVNGSKRVAVKAARSGRGKLTKGISSQIHAADPFNDAIREAMAMDEEADSFVEVTARRQAEGAVPAATFKKDSSTVRPYYHHSTGKK